MMDTLNIIIFASMISIIVLLFTKSTGCSVSVEVNGIRMRQLAATQGEAIRKICQRWNASAKHTTVAHLEEQPGDWIAPVPAAGIERVRFILTIRG